jgi:hypothetical protein
MGSRHILEICRRGGIRLLCWSKPISEKLWEVNDGAGGEPSVFPAVFQVFQAATKSSPPVDLANIFDLCNK